MSYIADVMRGLATTVKNVFRKPTTVQFPKESRTKTPRLRTSFALVHDSDGDEACIGCLMCERICPSEVITIKQSPKRESKFTGKQRAYAEDFTLDLSACILCELCVQVCPTDAILMTFEAETPTFSREDLLLTMPKLYANEKSKTMTWGTATLLMEMQDPKRGEPKVEKKAPAAASAAATAAPAKAAAEPAKAAAEPVKTAEPVPAAEPTPEPAKPEPPKPDGDSSA